MATPHFETDLEKIKQLAYLRKEENNRFRNFLKNKNIHKTDIHVKKLHDEIAPHIDCTICGNCCRNLSPYLTKNDLKNLTIGLNISADEVIEIYTETDEHGLSLKNLPCCFLKENKCTIYQHRPETCASFPHLHKPDFNSRLRRAIDNYAICPIIFNVIEKLKTEMNFE